MPPARSPRCKNCGSTPCVTYGKEITDKVLAVTKWVLVVLGALMALLGIAAVVLIANTIRLSIFSRRREIEVMKLVGATNWFVRVPFVLEGMLTGFAGAAGAVALLSIVYVAPDQPERRAHRPGAELPGRRGRARRRRWCCSGCCWARSAPV